MAGTILNALYILTSLTLNSSLRGGTITIIVPVYRCIERVSDLPNDQEQGTLCTSPRQYCLSELGSLAPRKKGKIIASKSSFPLWDI